MQKVKIFGSAILVLLLILSLSTGCDIQSSKNVTGANSSQYNISSSVDSVTESVKSVITTNPSHINSSVHTLKEDTATSNLREIDEPSSTKRNDSPSTTKVNDEPKKTQEPPKTIKLINSYVTKFGDTNEVAYPSFMFAYPDNWKISEEEVRHKRKR